MGYRTRTLIMSLSIMTAMTVSAAVGWRHGGAAPAPPAHAAMPPPVAFEQVAATGEAQVAHLGSYRSRRAAERRWDELRRKAGPLLSEAEADIEPIKLAQGRYLRLYAKLPEGVGCRDLRALDLYCRPRRED